MADVAAPVAPALTPAERAAFTRFCADFKEAAREKAGGAYARAAERYSAAADEAAADGAFAPDSAPVLTARVEALRASELAFGPGAAGSASGFLYAAAHPDDAGTLALARALLAATASRVAAWPRDCDATRAEDAFFGALKLPGGDDALAGAMPCCPLLACLSALQSLLSAAQREPRVADEALGHDVARAAAALRRAAGGQQAAALPARDASARVRHAAFRFLGGRAPPSTSPGGRALDVCVTMEDEALLELCAHTLERVNVVHMAVSQLATSAHPATAARARAFLTAASSACDGMTGQAQLFESFGTPRAVAGWGNMVEALTVQRRQAAERASGAQACGNPECWALERPRPNKAFKKCSRCRAVAYCGQECQAADWRRHKRAECAGTGGTGGAGTTGAGAGGPAAPAPEAPGPPAAAPPPWMHPDLLQFMTQEQYAQSMADMRASLLSQHGLQEEDVRRARERASR
jgi:hypothetical protein